MNLVNNNNGIIKESIAIFGGIAGDFLESRSCYAVVVDKVDARGYLGFQLRGDFFAGIVIELGIIGFLFEVWDPEFFVFIGI